MGPGVHQVRDDQAVCGRVMARTVSWFSCGAASAVATKLVLRDNPDAVPVYCATGSEHDDSKRFMADCEKWFGVEIITIQSEKFTDTWSVWEKTRWLAGIEGARCTVELKVAPRLAFQRPDDIHVFGYTADAQDITRATKLCENYPELTIKTPLIAAGLTKEAVLAMIENAGIVLPVMYRLGFHNNNCIPCVKATSPAYWALVRKQFPAEFERLAKLSRELGVRLCRVDGERVFIDEIPAGQKTNNPIQPSCDFLCHIAEVDMTATQTKPYVAP